MTNVFMMQELIKDIDAAFYEVLSKTNLLLTGKQMVHRNTHRQIQCEYIY